MISISNKKHSDRLCIALSDLAFSVLKSKPPSGIILDMTTSKSPRESSGKGRKSNLRMTPLSIHRITAPTYPTYCIAILLLCKVFNGYPAHRSLLLQEICSYVCHCYSFPKIYPKCVPLPLEASLGTPSVLEVTPALALVASICQCITLSLTGMFVKEISNINAAPHCPVELLTTADLPIKKRKGSKPAAISEPIPPEKKETITDSVTNVSKLLLSDCTNIAFALMNGLLKVEDFFSCISSFFILTFVFL
jgi:hypothetical protein